MFNIDLYLLRAGFVFADVTLGFSVYDSIEKPQEKIIIKKHYNKNCAYMNLIYY